MELDKIALIKHALLNEESTNPIKIIKNVMRNSFVSMHGPEHHFLDGGAFLVALKNAGLDFDLEKALNNLIERANKMPGAMCGYWGVCGSCTSLGAALSIVHDVSPLSNNIYYKEDMEFTSKVLAKMSEIGGPRCCKRNAFISINTAIDFVEEKYGIILEKEAISCEFSALNKQCIKERCPFYNK